MKLQPYHLHPAAVHFPIALLFVGGAAAVARFSRRAPDWLAAAESGLLWLGTVSAWAALGLGLVAEKYAPHVPPAWEVLAEHEALAWWTVGVFSALSVLRLSATRLKVSTGKRRALELSLWAVGLGLLIATAMHGGELVYRFGMGVGE